MPNIKSAVKRMRQNEKSRARNRHHKSRMRTEIKKFLHFLEEGKAEDAQRIFPSVCSIIDKTARKGIIHANTAARYKSRLSKRLAKSTS